MPKALKRKLIRQAKKREIRDEDAYVYGTLSKVKKRKERKRGRGKKSTG